PERIRRALPRAGTVLEAGCGLGQYVVLLRERGWRAAGVDWAVDALRMCRRLAPVPLAAMKLEALAIRDASLKAYVSLGVVEHDEAGPDGILAEAARGLKTGGGCSTPSRRSGCSATCCSRSRTGGGRGQRPARAVGILRAMSEASYRLVDAGDERVLTVDGQEFHTHYSERVIRMLIARKGP